MKKTILTVLVSFLLVSAAQALSYSQIRYHLEANGYKADDVRIVVRGDQAVVYRWDLPIPEPTDVVLPAAADCDAIFAVPKRFRKVVNGVIFAMTPEEKDAVRAQEAVAEAAALAERQAAKPNALKNAEKKLVAYLVAETAMATNALSVTPAVVEAAYDLWDALPNAQGDNKASKYNRLLKKVTLRGGTEFDVYAHP